MFRLPIQWDSAGAHSLPVLERHGSVRSSPTTEIEPLRTMLPWSFSVMIRIDLSLSTSPTVPWAAMTGPGIAWGMYMPVPGYKRNIATFLCAILPLGHLPRPYQTDHAGNCYLSTDKVIELLVYGYG